jgi:prepilin-type N-terminal cleavage/methylation domain-containing protein
MHKARPQQSGFTIVELLVVIVVIGVLAAKTIVSYTGLNQRAIVASLQSDLSTSVQRLKLYNTDNGTYPQSLDGSYCPVTPTDTRYCLKASSGTTYSYSSSSPYSSFALIATYGTTMYKVTDNSAPIAYLPVFTSGGTITTGGGYRTHTFTGGATITATNSGNVDISISGGGGGSGGGTGTENNDGYGGSSGSLSSLAIGGTIYVANGGGGGGGWSIYLGHCVNPAGNGSLGTTTPYALTGTTGGGSAGGSGGGCSGGAGGKVAGTVSVTAGQTVTIAVGGGGNGGAGVDGGDGGVAGGSGVVTIRYPG